MAEVSKASKPVHPLKRLLKKASRSKMSLSSPEAVVETEAPIVEEDLALQRQTSIALTVPEEQPEPSAQQSPVVEQPEPPSSPKEGGRRTSLVGKIKNLAGDRKSKKPPPKDEVLDRVEELDITQTSTDQSTGTGVKPVHVAKRVRGLLLAGPPFYPTTLVASVSTEAATSTDDMPEELSGVAFLATLSNQALMAGSSNQESVWSILDRAQFDFRANNTYSIEASVSITATDNGNPDNSIMLCVPLVPDEDSKVELAEFTLVKVPLDDTDAPLSASAWWPPWEWGKKASEPPSKTVRVWIPSTTKISVQVSWWGYRLWLPESVLKKMTNTETQITKRATMISTALTWLINHIPTSGIPLELLPVLVVVKAIVPVIGYIASFVGWYWSSVTGFDQGQGVVLSATWLLPIALIPGHWTYKPPINPTMPTAPTSPAPDPSTPITTPTSPTIPSPTTPPSSCDPPVGTPNPAPPLPSAGDGSPLIIIPPPGGIYVR